MEFLNDGHDNVGQFLHKQSEKHLREVGAVNNQNCVDLDTGAVLFDSDLLESLFNLISINGKVDTQNSKISEIVLCIWDCRRPMLCIMN